MLPLSKKYLAECPLNESLLLLFDHDQSATRIMLVYDYAAEVVSTAFADRERGIFTLDPPLRDFRQIAFEGVSDCEISRILRNRAYEAEREFQLGQAQVEAGDSKTRAL